MGISLHVSILLHLALWFYFYFVIFILFLFSFLFLLLFDGQTNRLEPTHNFERDIQRILKEQELVTKRSREFESRLPVPISPTTATPFVSQPVMTKVGFAAVQEMARLQEQEGLDDEDEDQDDVTISKEPERSPDPNMGGSLPQDTSDLSFLRFNPDFNKSPPNTCPPKPPSGLVPAAKTGKNVFGKFPLEIPTPIHSPKVGLKRFGSFRYKRATL